MPQYMESPTVPEILSEWTLDDARDAEGIWNQGIDRYEACDLEDRPEMVLAAQEMGIALAWFLSRRSVDPDAEGPMSDAEIAVIAWNVLVAVLGGDSDEMVTVGTDRPLRAAAAVVRELGCQSQELGGSGLMSEVFDDEGSCEIIEMALGLRAGSGSGSGSEFGEAVTLHSWFQSKPKEKPRLTFSKSIGDSPAQSASMAESVKPKFGKSKLLGSASSRLQSVNPTTIQHGLDSMHGALVASKLAKTDRKTGKLRIKKTGVVRAAIRPGKTIRKAIDGASISEHFRSMADEGADDSRS